MDTNLSEQTKNLLSIALMFLKLNPEMSITGTLMLKLRGIDLGREPNDIDLLLPDYAPKAVIPDSLGLKEVACASDGCSIKYEADGIKIDILSNGEQPEIINGIRLGTLDGLMNVKYIYSKQSGEQGEKHKQDLIKLGFYFESKN